MKVFLSSTYSDLVEHRRLAGEALERLGQQTGRMEVFGARPQEPSEACLDEVDKCELFVGVYAHRYGYVPAGSDLSITELEFRRAQATNKPLFCFLIDEDFPWPPRMVEGDPGKTKLARFKSSITQHVVRDTFTTAQDLALKVATSVGGYLTEQRAPLDPVVTGLRTLMEQKANAVEADRRAALEALSASVDIANRTLRYLADRRRSGQRNLEEEKVLAAGWSQAGLAILGLKDPPHQLAERYFVKAEYWSDPDPWTDERIKFSKIRLDEITRESRALLFGRTVAQLGVAGDASKAARP